MWPLLRSFYYYWQLELIAINFLINSLINIFIIAINLFRLWIQLFAIQGDYLNLKGWLPIPCERASAYARFSPARWDSTVKPECLA
jgi:hypothetical protein